MLKTLQLLLPLMVVGYFFRYSRVVLPLSVEEYQIGQLWSVAEASKAETGGGEGVEVLKNEPYDGVPLLHGQYRKGQYTHKIYHLQSKVPTIIRKIAPKGSLAIHEEAWNAYPYCRTVLTNPDYMKDNFFIKIETMHLPDRGETENAHGLPPDELSRREVVHIDIADDNEYLYAGDINPLTTPSTFKSAKTGRGPLVGDWKETVEPVMCAYKLVSVHFKWFGLQKMVESYTHTAIIPSGNIEVHFVTHCASSKHFHYVHHWTKETTSRGWIRRRNNNKLKNISDSLCGSYRKLHTFLTPTLTVAKDLPVVIFLTNPDCSPLPNMPPQYPRLFSKFHREVFCWIDAWHGLTMKDIRAIEAKAQKELEDQRKSGQVRGMTAG